MTKGLPRSAAHGDPLRLPITRRIFKAKDLTMIIDAAVGNGFGTLVLGDWPEGNVVLMGAVGYFEFKGSGADADLSDTWQGDYSIGTVPSTADAPLTGNLGDIMQSAALAAATAEVSPRTRNTHFAADIGEVHDNTDGSLELNLNLLIDDANIAGADTVITVNGELHLVFLMLGDD